MGTFLRHEPCPECGSKDNLARYQDGSATCFGCKHWEPPDGDGHKRTERMETDEEKRHDFVSGEYKALTNRALTRETCEKWHYQVNTEKKCQVANFRNSSGELVGQKLRFAGKDFKAIGGKNLPLYGAWLWGGGKSIVITEGELDALSMSQAFKHKWPVVSLPHGAQSAKAALERNYEYLDAYEKIVLMFDQDGPGREAAEEAATVLPVGKVFIAVLPHKDANEVLVKIGPEALVKAYWDAKPWRPDGIVSGEEFTLDRLMEEVCAGYSLPYPELNAKMLGVRKGEVTLITAGSGIGKSTFARQVAYHLHQEHGLTIGNVYLEENNTKTAQGYVAIHHGVPLGRLRHDKSLLTAEQWQDALTNVIHKRMFFYDHFGSLESKNLLTKLRYLATVCKVDFIILDHISIVTSGMESSSEGERKDIDILMTRLAALVQETGVGIIAVVHLKRSDKNFNEGGKVSLNDLRGSASLEQLSFNVLALERDQQAEDEEKDITRLRVLKCRETGDTGAADTLVYIRDTGLLELPAVETL